MCLFFFLLIINFPFNMLNYIQQLKVMDGHTSAWGGAWSPPGPLNRP